MAVFFVVLVAAYFFNCYNGAGEKGAPGAIMIPPLYAQASFER